MVKLNRLKKFLCSAVMAVVALTSVGAVMPAVEVSATQIWWKQGDIDGNGTVNLTDYVVFNRYFNGVQTPTSTYVTRMDLNEDKLVDEQDQTLLKNYNLGSVTLNPNGKYRDLLSNLSTENRVYLKHKTSLSASSYTPYTLSLQTSLLSAVPDMTLQRDHTYYFEFEPSIVFMYSGNDIFSGFIVDNHTIATAAHCVCTPTSSSTISFKNNIQIRVYSSDMSEILKTCTPDYIHVPKAYMQNYANLSTTTIVPYDYALIEVSADLSQYGKMQMGCMTDEFISDENTITSSGYYALNNVLYRCYSTGEIDASNNNTYDHSWAYISTTGALDGQSGGPVYYTPSGSLIKSVIGIHSSTDDDTGYRYDVKITPTIRRFYLANSNLTDYDS